MPQGYLGVAHCCEERLIVLGDRPSFNRYGTKRDSVHASTG